MRMIAFYFSAGLSPSPYLNTSYCTSFHHNSGTGISLARSPGRLVRHHWEGWKVKQQSWAQPSTVMLIWSITSQMDVSWCEVVGLCRQTIKSANGLAPSWPQQPAWLWLSFIARPPHSAASWGNQTVFIRIVILLNKAAALPVTSSRPQWRTIDWTTADPVSWEESSGLGVTILLAPAWASLI